MSGLLIESLGILFQTAGTLIFFRLLIVARKRPAVLLIMATAVLMLLRRLSFLFYILSGNTLTPFEQNHELIGLAVSFCLFGSAILIVPRIISFSRSTEDLREKHSTASQIIRNLAIPAFVIDRTHTVTHWNSACEKLTGVSAADMIGTRDTWKAVYLEQRPTLVDLIIDGAPEKEISKLYGEAFSPSESIEGGLEAEFYLPAINGGRWLFFTATPLRNSEGGICGAIEMFQDTTSQKESGINISRSASRLRTMHDLVQEIAFEKEIQPLMEKVVKLLGERMSITNVSILENTSRRPGNGFTPRIIASSSMGPENYENSTRALQKSGKGLSMKAAREKRMIVTPDVSLSPDFFPFVEKSVSELDIPILDGERVLGVISVEWKSPFDKTDEELFAILSGHLASLWIKIDLLSDMESIALTDQLTGLPNRHALFERLAGEEARLLRYGGEISIVMLDMASFKEVNDTYGHLAGDAALRAAAKFISGCLRSCDFASRFGGDEFVLLLLETKPEESERIIERISSGLSNINVQGMPLDLSADFGVASFPVDGKNLDNVLKKADIRMYEMKKRRA